MKEIKQEKKIEYDDDDDSGNQHTASNDDDDDFVDHERKMSYISTKYSARIENFKLVYIESQSIEASYRFILCLFLFISFHFIIDIADANTYNYMLFYVYAMGDVCWLGGLCSKGTFLFH